MRIIRNSIVLLSFVALLTSCKDEKVEDPEPTTTGFHTNLNGWKYVGSSNINFPTVNPLLFIRFELLYGNTFDDRTDIIFQTNDPNDYPTTQRVYRLIFNKNGSKYLLEPINVNIFPYSAVTTSSQEIKAVRTEGVFEDDISMILGLSTNSNLKVSAIQPKYQKEQLNIYSISNGALSLWKKQAYDLSKENGFLGNYFLLKPLYKGDQYPITLDEIQNNTHVAGLVENDGTLTFVAVIGTTPYRSLSLFKSLPGLENVKLGDYSGPVHRAIPKHNLAVAEVSDGDASTDLSNSLFVRKGNRLFMLLGFTNNKTQFIEVDRDKFLLKTNSNYSYPESAAKEKWIGMSTNNEGTLITTTSPFGIKKYDGKNSSSIDLPDFKQFKEGRGGIVDVFFNNDKLYLMVTNEYEMYFYTKDI
ncbi:MAG: hypothetical protein H6607_05760 [Flavobacteriales bacterium]|nr:hypothetical protein [Flavobacteriales bacterium]